MRDSDTYGVVVQNSPPNDFKDIYIGNIVFENNALGGVLFTSESNGVHYTLENNTFIGGESGITIDIKNILPNSSLVRNNLFTGQIIAPVHIVSSNDGGVEYHHNLFSLCSLMNSCEANWHSGNLHTNSNAHDNLFNLDPRFMDIGNGNFSLSSNSPVIESGDNSVIDIMHPNGDYPLPFTTIGAFEATSVSTRTTPPLDDVPDLSGLITQDSMVNTNLRYFINPSNDEDWFRFYLSNTGNPQIHLTSLPANYDLYVYNSAGQLMGSSTKDKKAAEMIKLTNTMAGYYYVRVVGVNGAWNGTNPYQLRFNVPGTP